MIYSLDTNTCIRYINGRAPNLLRRLQRTPPGEIVVCSVVRAELFYGASKSQTPALSITKQYRFLRPYSTAPFDDNAATEYGRIRAYLEGQGTPIGPVDLLIAAIALANNLILVTHNTAEFGRVPGLKIEDWEI